MEGYDKLYRGDWNSMSWDWQADDSVIVTLVKEGESVTYRLRMRNIYQENEVVISEEVIPHHTPQWVKDRMKEAQHGKPADQP